MDFYRFSNGLKLGASKHWSEALEVMTGEKAINADALLEYFQPLRAFLKVENKRLQDEHEVRQRLHEFNTNATQYAHNIQIAEWDHITDLLNETKKEIHEEAQRKYAAFHLNEYETYFKNINLDTLSDELVRRQIISVKNLEIYKLSADKQAELGEVKAQMEKIYNSATFCSYFEPNCTKEMELDPGK